MGTPIFFGGLVNFWADLDLAPSLGKRFPFSDEKQRYFISPTFSTRLDRGVPLGPGRTPRDPPESRKFEKSSTFCSSEKTVFFLGSRVIEEPSEWRGCYRRRPKNILRFHHEQQKLGVLTDHHEIRWNTTISRTASLPRWEINDFPGGDVDPRGQWGCHRTPGSC